MVLYSSGWGDPISEYARVVELVDSLDSGSSAHSGHAGSSPASRTKKGHPKGCPFSFCNRYDSVTATAIGTAFLRFSGKL